MGSVNTVLGAGHWWARPRGQTTALYFGTTVANAKWQSNRPMNDVMNDLAGRQVRFQATYDGEVGTVTGVWNRFDWVTWRTIREMARTVQGVGTTSGQDSRLARGQLVLGAADFQLVWVPEFAIAPTSPQLNTDAPAGRIWFSCSIVTYTDDSQATRVEDLGVVFATDNIYNPTTRGFGLYSENVADFGTLAPIT